MIPLSCPISCWNRCHGRRASIQLIYERNWQEKTLLRVRLNSSAFYRRPLATQKPGPLCIMRWVLLRWRKRMLPLQQAKNRATFTGPSPISQQAIQSRVLALLNLGFTGHILSTMKQTRCIVWEKSKKRS